MTDLQLRIIHRVARTLRIVGKWLGLIGGDYDTSEDAGRPVRHNER